MPLDDCFQTHISDLFPEILSIIFSYLDVRDKGRVSQVCSAWRDAVYHRNVWRGVEAKLHLRRANPSLFPSLVRRGIRRIQILSLRRSLKDVIVGIPNIESLNLSGCFKVTSNGLGHAFASEIPTLKELNLSLCKQVTDSSLGRVGKIARSLKNLEVLELGGCSNITNAGLMLCAVGLRKLKSLNLRSCRHVGDQGIGHLAGICPPKKCNTTTTVLDAGIDTDFPENYGTKELQNLGLQDCQKLTDQSLKYISIGLQNLQSINLSFCGNVTDTGLKFLSKMMNLRELNLRSCDNISDIGVGFLTEGGSKIVAIDVSFCERIGDQALVHMAQGLYHLRKISFSGCNNISDEGLGKLVEGIPELTTLNIGQCIKVTDRGLRLIAHNLRSLNCIDLYGCTKITTIGLEHIMQIPTLRTLNLGLWHKAK